MTMYEEALIEKMALAIELSSNASPTAYARAALSAIRDAGMTIASIPKGYTYQLVKLTEPGSIFTASTDPQPAPQTRPPAKTYGE